MANGRLRVFNWALRHRNKWRNGGIAPFILNLCTGRRSLTSFMFSAHLYLRCWYRRYPLNKRLVGPHSRSARIFPAPSVNRTVFSWLHRWQLSQTAEWPELSVMTGILYWYCLVFNPVTWDNHYNTGWIKHQLDATLCRFYFCRLTLHVSGVRRPSSGVFKN